MNALNMISLLRNLKPSRFIQQIATEAKRLSTVTLIPGDGVGPELAESVKDVVKNTGIPIEFNEMYLSEIDSNRSHSVMEVVNSIKNNNNVALKGAMQESVEPNAEDRDAVSLNLYLKQQLDLFACVVNIRTLSGIKTRHNRELNIIVVREQTEGEYSSLEHEVVPGVVECLKISTELKSRRIARFAFDLAVKYGRKKVTAVHKANIMKLGDGLFLRVCAEVSELYPSIKFDSIIIDNCCMQLVSRPEQFDVMVTPNLYGNVVSNLAAGLVGGAGVVAGRSVGNESVIFEPGARHAYQKAFGRNIANPAATLFCFADLLEHLNQQNHGQALRLAVENVIAEGKVRTRDLGGFASTTQFTDAVISKFAL